MVAYVFKNEPLRIKGAAQADPQLIGEVLAKLASDSDGHLEPSAVVSAAQDPDSALHPHFEWDDTKAAHAHRLDQARDLIRVIRIDEGVQSPPAFVSISDASGVSYRPVAEVRASSSLQLVVLKQAERDLVAFQRRYRELADICGLVKVAQEKVTARRTEFESRA